MRVFMFIVAIVGCLAFARPNEAAQPAAAQPAAAQPAAAPAPPVTPVVELERLVGLGKAIAAIRYESGNAYIYDELSAGLHKSAKEMEGGQIEFVAIVMRVNHDEVIIEVEPAGKVRLVLMHAAHPVFGNLRTVTYSGPATTQRIQMFSAPVGLRIGTEIKPETAKKLLRGDTLVMRGKLDSLPVWIESVFAPHAVGLISDWDVREVNPKKTY